MKCAGVDMRVLLNHISNENIDKFVKSLDIGNVNQIPGVPGVTRTLTGLVFMILDLHLKLPSLEHKLVWFNDNPNHFVFQMMVLQRHLSCRCLLAVSLCGTWERESEAGSTKTCFTVSVCQKSMIAWSFFGSSTQKR